MVFTIEIAMNVLNHSSMLENNLIDIAYTHHAISHYYLTEMENNNYRNRSHLILAFTFENDNIKNLENFIKDIKKWKNIYIESLYEENITCKLIYASSYYLSTIDKDKVILYNKRKRSYSEEETTLLNGITCKV